MKALPAHDALNTFFLLTGTFFDTPKEVGDPSLPPEGVFGFDLSNGSQEFLVSEVDFRIDHRRPNSLFFNSGFLKKSVFFETSTIK